MRWIVFTSLICAMVSGCLADEPPQPAGADGMPESFWWMPCEWSDHAPSAARDGWMERRVLHIAHQGAENEVPSATMYALKTSLRKGADMLEIDVHATSDGELVVLHDTTVDRTTNGAGAVEAMTLVEIKALDAAHWFVPGRNAPHDARPEEYVFRGARFGTAPIPEGCTPADFTIPTLREVLEEFPGVMMNIEIKNGPPQGQGYEQTLAQLLAEFGRGDDTVVASFIDSWTETFRLFNGDVDTSTGTGQAAVFTVTTQGFAPGSPTLLHDALQVPVAFEGVVVIDEDGDFVRDAHANGLAVHVWTINDPETIHWLIDIGVDGIMTAESAVLEPILQERGVAWT